MLREISKDIRYGSITIHICVQSESSWNTYVESSLFRSLFERISGKPYETKDFPGPLVQALLDFIPIVSRTKQVSGLEGAWANADSDLETWVAAFETFKNLPARIVAEWDAAVSEANLPPGDPDTAPPEALSENQKKVPA